eukprot:276307-Amphidinium_carterae.1
MASHPKLSFHRLGIDGIPYPKLSFHRLGIDGIPYHASCHSIDLASMASQVVIPSTWHRWHHPKLSFHAMFNMFNRAKLIFGFGLLLCTLFESLVLRYVTQVGGRFVYTPPKAMTV